MSPTVKNSITERVQYTGVIVPEQEQEHRKTQEEEQQCTQEASERSTSN